MSSFSSRRVRFDDSPERSRPEADRRISLPDQPFNAGLLTRAPPLDVVASGVEWSAEDAYSTRASRLRMCLPHAAHIRRASDSDARSYMGGAHSQEQFAMKEQAIQPTPACTDPRVSDARDIGIPRFHSRLASTNVPQPQRVPDALLSPGVHTYPEKEQLDSDIPSALTSRRDSAYYSIFDPSPLPPTYQPQNAVPLHSSTRPLRPALRQSHSDVDLASLHRGTNLSRNASARLEEGGVRAHRGVFSKLYGLSRNRSGTKSQFSHTDYSRSRANSCDSIALTSARGLDRYKSNASGISLGETLDPDDPKVTGAPPNRIDQENHAKATFGSYTTMEKKKKRRASIQYHVSSLIERQNFILILSKALMIFGAPSHRLESQLSATARVLEVEAQFVHMPNIVIASFGDSDSRTTQTHFIKVNGRLELGRLHSVHNLYRQVVHDEVGVEEATRELKKMIKSEPIYGIFIRCAIAALCAGLICPLAFGGSFVDMLVSGGEGALLCYLQLGVASKNAMYSNVFEISVAILMSFIARGLSSIPSQIFCYSAISSSGVVLILPGYMILCSALELASKNIVSGSVKLTFAVVYSLFLGFGLTIGSDIYFLLDPRARHAQIAATALLDKVIIHGSFVADNTTQPTGFAGTFSFTNSTGGRDMTNWVEGCYRDPSWPWYFQPFPFWTLFILVPAYSLFSSSWNLQPFRSKQLPIMVAISCCSFAANKAANHFIFNRSDVVSAIGAFVIGILGNMYSRLTTNGTSFTSMVTGVLFLVPAGIAATGGLSMNYRGQDGDEYSNGLAIGLRMIQVAIGITVGLFGSGLVVYSFGRSKRGAIFAF